MDFLFKDRGSGKRAIKPSKEAEVLDALIPDHESDDSDFELDKHRGGGGDSDDNDTDDDKSNSEGSDEDSDSEAGGDSDNNESVDEDEVLRLKSNLTTEELISLAKRQTQAHASADGSRAPLARVCGTCLGTHSDHTNEIVDCDGCGLSVHEACYGIQEPAGGSTGGASTASSACTEPWFCEVCMAGLSSPPPCDLCPVVGGIYKETDTGGWVHLICALYTPHVSFFDQERITRPTLFELNYQSWGRRACILCKDIKFARTGVCIECDAGMCKSYFHVSCAQEAGLLSEPSEDDHEQFFGHCKAHSDREQIKRRKKNWVSHQLSYRQRGAAILAEREADKVSEPGVKETPSQRNSRKLAESRARWQKSKQKDHWMPTQKMSRLLLTSNTAIKKFQRKAELHEWNVEAMEEEEANKQVVADIRKKWHVPPAWSVEFVAYYHDRAARIKEMQETLAEAVIINNQLKEQDEETCAQYRNLVAESETASESATDLKKIYKVYKDLLVKFDPLGRALKSPGRSKTPIKQVQAVATPRPVRRLTSATSPAVSGLKSCRLCGSSSDQHLLAHCDICKHSYHIHCLTPPLAKMPKKTKQYGWQCSECDKGDPSVALATPQAQTVDLEAPRASRARGNTSRLGSSVLSDSDAESVRNSVEAAAENTPSQSRRSHKKLKSLSKAESTPSDQKKSLDTTPINAESTPSQPRSKDGKFGPKPKPIESSPVPVKASPIVPISPPASASTPSQPRTKDGKFGPKPKPKESTPSLPIAPVESIASILSQPRVPIDYTPPCDISNVSLPPAPSPVKTPKKRGRPTGYRKDPVTGEWKKTCDEPSAKSRRKVPKLNSSFGSPPAIPPMALVTAQASNPVTPISMKEPEDQIATPPNEKKIESAVSPSFDPPDIPLNLPPKKFFKSKAAQKEDVGTPATVSPPPNPENERTNFRKWLDDKLSPIKGVNSSNNSSADEPTLNGVEREDLRTSKHVASDESSADEAEASPDKNDSFPSDKSEEKEARKERKRLKREEKEKRREERRKKKLLKSQENLVYNIVEDRADIEEDEDSCVVRIAPKPIKLKIKPITKPEENSDKSSDFAIVTSEQGDSGGDRAVTNMHPKKKLAHILEHSDTLATVANNFPVVNSSLVHSTLPFLQPLASADNLNNINKPPPPLPVIGGNNKKLEHGNVLVTRNGIGHHSPTMDDYEFKDEEPSRMSNTHKPSPPAKPKKPNNENSGKKGRDVRTKCDVCLGEGTNSNLVRCDECLKCYHFGCLNPPVKKTPKVSGWAWSCSDCAPSDEDRGWHL